ncbi:MAG: RloB family protein [Candidatus Methanomethylophilaceae archaeon]|nr:RloB family protein [Candidatus Methanomethylophilaceae archaeon]
MNLHQLRSKILIVTEGYTEKKYFEKFRERDVDYEVIVRKSPDNNAKKVFKFCTNEIKNIGLDVKNDDSAYCVIDVDYNSEDTLNKILKEAKKNNIHIILSKPCFEVFFILHFDRDIDGLAEPKDAEMELNNYIPGYCKTGDYWKLLSKSQKKAVEYSRGYVIGESIDLKRCCNGTNVYEFFDEITRRKKKVP